MNDTYQTNKKVVFQVRHASLQRHRPCACCLSHICEMSTTIRLTQNVMRFFRSFVCIHASSLDSIIVQNGAIQLFESQSIDPHFQHVLLLLFIIIFFRFLLLFNVLNDREEHIICLHYKSMFGYFTKLAHWSFGRNEKRTCL